MERSPSSEVNRRSVNQEIPTDFFLRRTQAGTAFQNSFLLNGIGKTTPLSDRILNHYAFRNLLFRKIALNVYISITGFNISSSSSCEQSEFMDSVL
jgi:hypothetical protein